MENLCMEPVLRGTYSEVHAIDIRYFLIFIFFPTGEDTCDYFYKILFFQK